MLLHPTTNKITYNQKIILTEKGKETKQMAVNGARENVKDERS